MNISDYLAEVTKLTNTNLQLLKVLNDSLTTDAKHLSFTIDDQTLAIPSFISLENKINTLQSNFENLVNAPKTSEVYFSFDGDSRAVYMRGYEQGPDAVYLSDPMSDTSDHVFYHEDNNIFKDFLDPVPYLKFQISPISNDITTLDIRKVVAKSNAAKAEFASLLAGNDPESTNSSPCLSMDWGEMNKILYKYEEGKDYIMYDTIQKLPVRSGQGYGVYVIKEVVAEEMDENLNQHYVVKIDLNADTDYGYQNSLTYKLFDQTIERQLQNGDVLVNGSGTAKFKIESLNFNTGEMRLWNIHNGFANLTANSSSDYSNVPTSATLKFFSNEEYFGDLNYAKVPLEEDQYIFVAVAPLNDRMNIRASWGGGVLLDVYEYRSADDANQTYQDYYKNCVNIGDILNEISKVMSNTTTLLTEDEINEISSAKLSHDDILQEVVKINDHLNDNTALSTIKSLYQTKQNLKTKLNQIQLQIVQQQTIISTTNFQDTTGVREKAQNILTDLNKQKSDIINQMNDNMQAIAMTAENATIPIDRAKYRIRGFVDFKSFVDTINIKQERIKGIQVRYQYVNPKNESVGKATSFTHKGKDFLFSDWNDLYTPLRPRVRTENGKYESYSDESDANEPSFNQFDIPITQGEDVNIKIRMIYDYGYPFIQMTSDWSDVLTVSFPVELIQDIDVVDIIAENNNDIETRRFENILIDNGVTKHVDDAITDQDKIYFHNPDNIASGFYTADERRIIPLSDKLKDMNDIIARIVDEVENDAATQLKVTVTYGSDSVVVIKPNTINNIVFKDFKDFQNIKVGNWIRMGETLTNWYVGSATIDGYNYYRFKMSTYNDINQFAETYCTISLTNISNKIVRVYPLFSATSDTLVSNVNYVDDDTKNKYKNVIMMIPQGSGSNDFIYTDQQVNQIITFRNCDPYNSDVYYTDQNSGITPAGGSWSGDKVLQQDNLLSAYNDGTTYPYLDIMPGAPYVEGSKLIYAGTSVYPKIESRESLFMTPAEAFSYKAINPGETISIPLLLRYNVIQESDYQVTKIMSFDIKTSLYKDPTNYTMKFVTGYNMTDKNSIGYTDMYSGLYIPSINNTSSSSSSTSWWKKFFGIK